MQQDDRLTANWFDPLFRAYTMRRTFSDAARLQGILDFEAALARAQARAGVIPAASAKVIGDHCRAEQYDLAALAQSSASAGNSAIPVIKELTRRVEASDPDAARHVHGGATSQDAMDTGLVLQLRQGFDLLDADALGLCASLTKLAEQYKDTPIAGRTWLQHGAPTTFGLKVAGWLSAMVRHVHRLHDARLQALVIQFGGEVGSLAALGEHAQPVARFLAEDLQLRAEDPWHAHRDRLVEIAAALGMLTGTLGKIARDIALMAQSEIGEVAEPSAPGKGGSSSMPHKNNPVYCAAILATATRMPALVSIMFSAMPQEHERALGGWQAEWETLPEVFMLSAGALLHMRQIIDGLVVFPDRMRANLDAAKLATLYDIPAYTLAASRLVESTLVHCAAALRS